MTKEELKQEAEEWINKWELCNKCDHKVQCIEDNAMCPQVVERAYLASAEPREKRIEELEYQLTHRNCVDCSNHSSKLRMRTLELEKENAELKTAIALKDEEMGCIETDFNTFKSQAKELLKRFIALENCTLDYDDIKEAEQFLKETSND